MLKWLQYNPPPPLGIRIFALILIVSSLMQLHMLFFTYGLTGLYAKMFDYLPPCLLDLRYCVSVSLRIIGLLCGFSLWARREAGRKMLLILMGFSLVTVFWKHPYIANERYVHFILSQPLAASVDLTLISASMLRAIVAGTGIFYTLSDSIFFIFVIIYFNRSDVKQWFKLPHA